MQFRNSNFSEKKKKERKEREKERQTDRKKERDREGQAAGKQIHTSICKDKFAKSSILGFSASSLLERKRITNSQSLEKQALKQFLVNQGVHPSVGLQQSVPPTRRPRDRHRQPENVHTLGVGPVNFSAFDHSSPSRK